MHWCLIGYALTFIVLFGNFYYQTYRRQPRREGLSKSAKALSNGAPNGMAASNGVSGKMVEKPVVAENGRRKRKGRAKRD